MRTEDFIFLKNLLVQKSGIYLTDDKVYLVKARLEPVVKSENLNSIEELMTRLRWSRDTRLLNTVIDVMTTNETFFFRDGAPFDALKTNVIPSLIKERESTHMLNIWCAACSSGQEPYSIAMLLREYFPELQNWNITIIGSDISYAMIEKAKVGYYTQFEIDRGLPPNMMKYFELHDRGMKVKEEIRSMVDFKRDNLIEPWSDSFPMMDIVFIRNVLIYFELASKKRILKNVDKILKHDGYLFLGQSETVSQLNVPFETSHIGTASCYRPKRLNKENALH